MVVTIGIFLAGILQNDDSPTGLAAVKATPENAYLSTMSVVPVSINFIIWGLWNKYM